MRTLFVVRAALWVVFFSLVAGPGPAVEKTLQNDSFSGSGTVNCVLGQSFAEGDIAAARFTPLPGDYPFQILEVQILACPPSTQGDLVLIIWQDDGVSNQPGTLLYDELFTIYGSDIAINGLDVSAQNLVISSGSIRVGFEYFFGPAQVGIATDTDGHVIPQPNFIYDEGTFGWRPADFFQVEDDWIIRVRIDANSEPPLFADGFESGDTTGWSGTVQ